MSIKKEMKQEFHVIFKSVKEMDNFVNKSKRATEKYKNLSIKHKQLLLAFNDSKRKLQKLMDYLGKLMPGVGSKYYSDILDFLKESGGL